MFQFWTTINNCGPLQSFRLSAQRVFRAEGPCVCLAQPVGLGHGINLMFSAGVDGDRASLEGLTARCSVHRNLFPTSLDAEGISEGSRRSRSAPTEKGAESSANRPRRRSQTVRSDDLRPPSGSILIRGLRSVGALRDPRLLSVTVSRSIRSYSFSYSE